MKHRSCVKMHYLNPGTCVFETFQTSIDTSIAWVDRCRLEHARQEVMEICSSDEEAGDPLLNQLNEVVAELSLPLGRTQQVTLKLHF